MRSRVVGFVLAALVAISAGHSDDADDDGAYHQEEAGQQEEDDDLAVFFLADASDGLCLGRDASFQRCDQSTLWFASGTPGHYSLHLVPEFEDGADLCLDRKSCHSRKSMARLHDCSHCGALHWNLEGDEEAGYLLTEDDGKNCLARDAGGLPTTRMTHCAVRAWHCPSFAENRNTLLYYTPLSALTHN
jgi:hypothetical protein